MKRIIALWALLGAGYVALETLWRGYSHPSMLIVGDRKSTRLNSSH